MAGSGAYNVELVAYCPERHSGLVASWLRQPHVSRWWGDPEKVAQELSLPPSGGGEALIATDGVPVGYVRWQVPARKELDAAGLHEVPDDVVDIDIAIGEVDHLGHGIGSRALAMLRERLVKDGAVMVMLATSVDNTRAVRAYEKAGFSRRREFIDTDGGEYWLLVFEARPGEQARRPDAPEARSRLSGDAGAQAACPPVGP